MTTDLKPGDLVTVTHSHRNLLRPVWVPRMDKFINQLCIVNQKFYFRDAPNEVAYAISLLEDKPNYYWFSPIVIKKL